MREAREPWHSDHYELAVQEAENILDSYMEEESYTTQVPSTELEPGEFEDEIRDAVDEIELNDGYDFHGKMLLASGATATAAGAFGVATGTPVAAGAMILGGSHYLAARNRNNVPAVEEIETKAFLQDSMQDNLTVEEIGGEYRINFEYTE